MDTRDSRDLPPLTNDDRQAAQEALGYLNFSGGKPDPRFQQHLNRLTTLLGPDDSWRRLFALLCSELQSQQASNATFQNSEQASAVLALTIDGLEPAYRRHHSDLLFHLQPQDYHNPFFLARLFEAVLQQGPPWNERERIVEGSLDLVNDFLGHRPVAVLESGRQMQPYDHERFRPFPLYITGAGAADGPWSELIVATLEQLNATPRDLLAEAQFDPTQLDEIAWDPRAYDHQHPMYRRTNYMFGEWDPHLIDSKGRYRRFVIRSIVLDAIRDWMKTTTQLPHRQALFEASAVLCGTMLMASAISGGGPGAYASSVSLATLLPRIARLRDAFYSRLLNGVTGPMADRLFKESEKARQPFGHVRHHLNLYVAHLGAKQLQHRHLAFLYARMGYPQASQSEANVIPSTSARFETEIEWRLTSAQLQLDRGELRDAVTRLRECEDLLHRGIACGGLLDPWNILGFGGNFPLFHSREDSVPDPRAEKLIDLMEMIFGLYSRCLSESAAEQETQLQGELSASFQKLADWWDKFATIAVSEFTPVSGGESYQSAVQVAETLAEWRKAGEAAGAISFWRSQVHRFESGKSYALVLEALLRKRDSVAAMGLLMQWLSNAEDVGLEAGPYSFHLMV
ncbi:MAG TPA: hypothetical protein VHB77_21455 [Planctomycetaceae bacterium]|nr:hypothetical protein [Planctomycetaceae bacterium]